MAAVPAVALVVLALGLACSACGPTAAGDPTPQAETPAAPDAPAPPEGVPVPEERVGESPEADGAELLPAEIATVGWDRVSNAPIVLLRELSTGQVVPIWVGIAEARAIAVALHEVEFPRPLTHDLMTDLISKLGAELEEVVVHDLVDGTYLGTLRLRVGDGEETLEVDTRPSDGLALAARTGAAISIARKILDAAPDYEFLAPEGSDQVVRISGLTLVAPTAELRQRFALPERPGLVVTRATGAAAEQGLRRGDLIVAVNGAIPEEPVDFLDAVRKAPPGVALELTCWRDGEEVRLELVPELEPFPREGEEKPHQVA